MGFSFDRSSSQQKIKRQPYNLVSSQNQDNKIYPHYVYPTASPTSPQYFVNNTVYDGATPTQNWAHTTWTTSLSYSIGSNYWVDLVRILATAGDALTRITINGNTLSSFQRFYSGDLFNVTIDAYGYGATISAYLADTYYVGYMAVIPAREVITTGGSIVWPPALSGYQAMRDI